MNRLKFLEKFAQVLEVLKDEIIEDCSLDLKNDSVKIILDDTVTDQEQEKLQNDFLDLEISRAVVVKARRESTRIFIMFKA